MQGLPATLHRDFRLRLNDLAGAMEGLQGLRAPMRIKRGSG